ncbi:MAG: glycosyltransferase [Bacteroidetes bacterium]|nr:glycosyltransferase [Bacteroidota bacterium]
MLSIVIPVFNERDTVRVLLDRVHAALTPGWRRQVIVVDDGSTDGTPDQLRAWLAAAQQTPDASESQTTFTLVEMPVNQGKGAALRKGFAHCQGHVVLIQDADLEYDPADYPALLAPFVPPVPMASGAKPSAAPARVVYGSRILHPGNHRHSALRFYLGGRLVTLVTNMLFGSRLTDEPTGYKLFRRDVLEAIPLQCQGFEFCPEVTAKLLRLGVAIQEVPIHYAPRKPEEGKKIGWKDGVQALWTLWRWRWQSF